MIAKKTLLVGALAVAVALGVALGQDAAATYRQGVDRQRAGDLEGAAALYRKTLELDGTNVAALSNLGATLAALGKYDEAISEYQLALKNAPPQVRPLLQRNLALAWYKSGRLQQAVDLLIELHSAQPQERELALLAGDCLLQLGEPGKAVSLLEPLAGAASGDKGLAYVLGMSYLRTGKTAEAQRVLDPILKDESSAEGRYALGMAMFTSRDYPAAVKAFARALDLNPALPHLNSYYGQALLFTGDADGALTAFRRQLATDPTDYEANFQSGSILNRRHRPAEAEALLRRAALLRPKSGAAHLALAEAELAEAKDTEARKELEAIVREWPEFGAAHSLLAQAYTRAGLKTAALREQGLGAKYASAATDAPTGVPVGTKAPRFLLPPAAGGQPVNITSPESGKPVVLVFGSYSCPNFRKASPVLNELAQSLGKQIAFLQVYIREAHATDQWQSTINARENIELAPASTAAKKQEYAMLCQRKLHLRFPAVIDGIGDAAEKAYSAWPSRVYVLSADGYVRYSSGLTEEQFDRAALEAAVRGVLPARPH